MISFTQYLIERFQFTLEYHKKLNPDIWKNGQLDPALVEIIRKNAKVFTEYSGLDFSKVKDIIFTGSNANFNYTESSDIDVHILYDETGLDTDKIYDKKVEWTYKNNLKFKGYPVEFYVQDYQETLPKGQGIYSVKNSKWLLEPTHLDIKRIFDNPYLIHKAQHLIKDFNRLLESGTVDTIKAFKDKLWKMRTRGLEGKGEFSTENIIYKDARNRGLVSKLNQKLLKMEGKSGTEETDEK